MPKHIGLEHDKLGAPASHKVSKCLFCSRLSTLIEYRSVSRCCGRFSAAHAQAERADGRGGGQGRPWGGPTPVVEVCEVLCACVSGARCAVC